MMKHAPTCSGSGFCFSEQPFQNEIRPAVSDDVSTSREQVRQEYRRRQVLGILETVSLHRSIALICQ